MNGSGCGVNYKGSPSGLSGEPLQTMRAAGCGRVRFADSEPSTQAADRPVEQPPAPNISSSFGGEQRSSAWTPDWETGH